MLRICHKNVFSFDQKAKSSIIGTIGQIIRTEGPSSLYKGIVPAILQDTPKRATKFFTFEQYKVLFSAERNKPSAIAIGMAGTCSGLTEALIITPFEVRWGETWVYNIKSCSAR